MSVQLCFCRFWPTVLSVAPLAHCVVCLSVCLSVTRWYCVKLRQARIRKSSPTDSPRPLVLALYGSSRIRKGSPQARALNRNEVGKIDVYRLIYVTVSQKRCKVVQKLLSITIGSRSHTRFRLVQKSTTMDDL